MEGTNRYEWNINETQRGLRGVHHPGDLKTQVPRSACDIHLLVVPSYLYVQRTVMSRVYVRGKSTTSCGRSRLKFP